LHVAYRPAVVSQPSLVVLTEFLPFFGGKEMYAQTHTACLLLNTHMIVSSAVEYHAAHTRGRRTKFNPG